MIRLYKIVFIILTLLILASCKEKDENNEQPVYNFKDQTLQGIIGGAAWNFKYGGFRTSAIDTSRYWIELYGQLETDASPCLNNKGYDDLVLMSLPKQIGLYELGNLQVTLYETGNNINKSVYSGAVEILSVENNIMTGRIDAYLNDDYLVNGNFSANKCD
ncbi:MAG: hypothetical protein HY738_10780 [Bacteroidia bacterium]|nr:hypothetical protein [Bacteroidia bacterium]